MTSATAIAHPNIALVKYWGKQTRGDNLPAVPSLSITLDRLRARTHVAEAPADEFSLNGEEKRSIAHDPKLESFLEFARTHHDLPPIRVDSDNNFPTSAGLASSAAGFAALAVALDTAFGWRLSNAEMSTLARVGSASAARSIDGGFVGLASPDYVANPIAPADHWPLQVVIAITATQPKATSSTDGMLTSARSSPYSAQWLQTAAADYEAARFAVVAREFAALAAVAEHSCLQMHGLMQSSVPALRYWNPATVAAMDAVAELQDAGCAVFFTIDAGPQLKAICLPHEVERVATALAAVPGVLQVERVGIGGPARCISD